MPVVHAVGGLKDTVPPVDDQGRGGLGYTFESYNGDDFREAIHRCLSLYHNDRDAFRALQHRDLCQDFSWGVPARRYMELFRQMCSR